MTIASLVGPGLSASEALAMGERLVALHEKIADIYAKEMHAITGCGANAAYADFRDMLWDAVKLPHVPEEVRNGF